MAVKRKIGGSCRDSRKVFGIGTLWLEISTERCPQIVRLGSLDFIIPNPKRKFHYGKFREGDQFSNLGFQLIAKSKMKIPF
jgi:hypothetical protein